MPSWLIYNKSISGGIQLLFGLGCFLWFFYFYTHIEELSQKSKNLLLILGLILWFIAVFYPCLETIKTLYFQAN